MMVEMITDVSGAAADTQKSFGFLALCKNTVKIVTGCILASKVRENCIQRTEESEGKKIIGNHNSCSHNELSTYFF
jgi:hypothetical protein